MNVKKISEEISNLKRKRFELQAELTSSVDNNKVHGINKARSKERRQSVMYNLINLTPKPMHH